MSAATTKKKADKGGSADKNAPVAVEDLKLYQVLVAPHVSEKSSRLADKARQIVFEVRTDATKPSIKLAVEKMFNVQVESVTVTNVQGKRKGGRNAGRRQDWKKACVRLKPGQDINFVGQQ
jgi:large subunit ribosomal protein L23